MCHCSTAKGWPHSKCIANTVHSWAASFPHSPPRNTTSKQTNPCTHLLGSESTFVSSTSTDDLWCQNISLVFNHDSNWVRVGKGLFTLSYNTLLIKRKQDVMILILMWESNWGLLLMIPSEVITIKSKINFFHKIILLRILTNEMLPVTYYFIKKKKI